jgi:transglutaminase-like putative cysteine protease
MITTRSRLIRSIASIAVAWIVHPAAAGWTTVEEAWYAMTLGGQPCGHLRTTLQQDGDLFRTLSESTLSVGRAGASVTVTISSTFDERADHTPVAASLTQSMGGAPTTTDWTFSPTGIEVKAQQGGRATTSTKPLPPAGWLTPRAADALRKKALKDGLVTVEFTTIDPQNGTAPMSVKSQRTGTGPLTIDGKQLAGTTWTTRTSLLPIDTIEEYDAAGVMVRQVTPMALGRIEAVLTTKDKALGGGGAAGAVAAAAPELLVASFIQLEPSVPDLDCAEIVVWDLRTKDGTPLDLPDAGGQSTRRTDRGEQVIVKRGATTPAPTGDALNEFLEPSQMCDTNDARLKALAKRALRGKEQAPAAERAEVLRAFVLEYIERKDLGSAFASASDVARSKSGDCSEHATLLAALLRCAGIPARGATGLVYADSFAGGKHVMGWHMWTQAVIDGAWVDLDATRPDCAFDGGHILTAVSALGDGGLGGDLGSVVALMGNLAVDGVEVGGARKPAP